MSVPMVSEGRFIKLAGKWVDIITPRSEVMLFEPALCKEILDKFNDRNRKLRRFSADRYADDMREGKWILNGETIKWSIHGRLLDGQNRLMGCVLAKTPFMSWVTFGLSDDAFDTIDIGGVRTGADILGIGGEKNTVGLTALLALLWLDDKGEVEHVGKTPPKHELADILAKHPDAREAAALCKYRFRMKFLQPRIVAFCLCKFSRIDFAAAHKFFEDLKEGSGLEHGDPVLVLRNRLMVQRKLPVDEVLAIVIKAWNARRMGKKVSFLRWAGGDAVGEKFPTIC
jgi:hypothetical protein